MSQIALYGLAPMGPIAGNSHILRPEHDYPVSRSKFPEGYVTLDTVQIVFQNFASKP